MKKFLLSIISSVIVISFLLVPAVVFGQMTLNEGLNEFQNEAGYGGATLPQVIGNVVRIVLSLLGLIATILLIAGGFMWMTSGGNEEKIAKAKQLMGAAIIGLVIVIVAYAAATFVVNQLTNVTAP